MIAFGRHDFFQFPRQPRKRAYALFLQRGADLHHARAAENVLKHIAAVHHAAGADNLDFRLQPLVKSTHIGQRRGLQIGAADAETLPAAVGEVRATIAV